MAEQIWWTLQEFCTRLSLNQQRTAKVLVRAPSRMRGKRVEYDLRIASAMIFRELHGIDWEHLCHTCLQPLPPLMLSPKESSDQDDLNL